MKKEELIALGIDEEMALKVLDGFKNYVPYERFQEVVNEKNKYKEDLKERDKQLNSLKDINVDELKDTITNLQSENKKNKEIYENDLKNIRIENAIEKAITNAKGKNSKAVKALLELDKLELLEDGTLKGIDEQLTSLKASDDTSFLFNEVVKNDLKGVNPGEGSENVGQNLDYSKMTYDEIVKAMEN